MALGILMLCAVMGGEQQYQQQNSSINDTLVTVSVTRPLRVRPTRASMYVVVEGTAETTPGALARVNEKARIVADTLARWGQRVTVEEPMPFRVAVAQTPGGYAAPSSVPYAANTLIRVTVHRLQDFAAVQAAVLTAGASANTGHTFEYAGADSVWRAEVERSSAGARTSAEALAAANGRRLGTLLDMNVNTAGSGGGPPQLNLDLRSPSHYAPAPELTYQLNVSARFRLLPRESP